MSIIGSSSGFPGVAAGTATRHGGDASGASGTGGSIVVLGGGADAAGPGTGGSTSFLSYGDGTVMTGGSMLTAAGSGAMAAGTGGSITLVAGTAATPGGIVLRERSNNVVVVSNDMATIRSLTVLGLAQFGGNISIPTGSITAGRITVLTGGIGILGGGLSITGGDLFYGSAGLISLVAAPTQPVIIRSDTAASGAGGTVSINGGSTLDSFASGGSVILRPETSQAGGSQPLGALALVAARGNSSIALNASQNVLLATTINSNAISLSSAGAPISAGGTGVALSLGAAAGTFLLSGGALTLSSGASSYAVLQASAATSTATAGSDLLLLSEHTAPVTATQKQLAAKAALAAVFRV